jgi:protein-L-isoaspartate(D-aspartate) O-methyltransferase
LKEWGKILSKEGFLHNPTHSDTFNAVDRRDFLPEDLKKYSDADEPIPILFNQTQSAPHMNAIFVNYGEPDENDDVLEIGTGSGYLTVILSFLSKRVVSVEYLRDMLAWSSKNIAKYERKNIDLVSGNINNLCFKRRFDLIISSASFRNEPTFLNRLLKPEGTMVYPLGKFPPQKLIGIKGGKRQELGWVAFVNISD